MKQLFISKTKSMKSVYSATVLLLLMIMAAIDVSAQDSNKLINLEINNQALSYALKKFSNVSGYKVNFSSQDIQGYKVSINAVNEKSITVLKKILEGKPFEYNLNGRFITIRPITKRAQAPNNSKKKADI